MGNRLTVLGFGKYKGMSLEQVAITDYTYLSYLIGEAPTGRRPNVDLPKLVKEGIFELRERLESFEPQRNCAIPGCNHHARYLFVHVSPHRVETSEDYVCCKDFSSFSQYAHANMIKRGRAEDLWFNIYRISFSTIDTIYSELLSMQRNWPTPSELSELHRVLLWATGWELGKERPSRVALEWLAEREGLSQQELLSKYGADGLKKKLTQLTPTINRHIQEALKVHFENLEFTKL